MDQLLLATAGGSSSGAGTVTRKRALVDVVVGPDVGVKVKSGSWSSSPGVGCGVVSVVGTGGEGRCLGLLGGGEVVT